MTILETRSETLRTLNRVINNVVQTTVVYITVVPICDVLTMVLGNSRD